jgi:hypothetical protein
MPRKQISATWIAARKEAVNNYLGIEEMPIKPVVISYNPAAQWYISYLESKGIKSKTIQLGAGVKKIIVNKSVCPHCGGKGTK